MLQRGWGVIRDFMEVLATRGRKNAIYRGQADENWALIPSIFRPKSYGIKHLTRLGDWKRRASRFASPLPTDDVEWLILAQHYGLATPLLDWTTGPLVALFFACDDRKNRKRDGCVWWSRRTVFDEVDDTMMIEVFKPVRERPLLINAVGRNVRSTAQDSLLSLHTPSDFQTLTAERIFTVKAADKVATLAALEKLGFSGERLHFDITKLVARFKEEIASQRVGATY